MHDLADLFCEMYDTLSDADIRSRGEDWLTDSNLAQLSDAIVTHAEQGTLTREWLAMRVDNASDPAAARFACLRGLDRVFAHVNPLTADVAPEHLQDYAMSVAEEQRLDTGAAGGALLPRLRERGRPSQLPASRRDVVRSVVRIPEASFTAISYEDMPEAARFHRPEIERGLVVGCAPFVGDPDELHFAVDEREAGRFYRITPRDLDETCCRIPDVIEAMEASGAQLGVVPELMLSAALLEAWQTELAKPRSGGTLQWILVGSGDLDGGRRPVNAAVLLDARTGRPLGRQDKMNPFNFSPEELERWNLRDVLGDQHVDEDLEPGDRLVVLDAGGVRLAILVCEDLSDVADLAGLVRDVGVSLLLVPVFARPTKDRRWERASADVHATATGSTIIVANSMVMERVLDDEQGTALVVWPGAGDALVLRTDDPAGAACARLLPDGSAEAA